MNWRLTLGLAVFSAVLVAVLLPALSKATPPGKNGEIAFAQFRREPDPAREEIWVANPDGSGLRRLTTARPVFLEDRPSWSPDGSKLLFTSNAPHDGIPGNGRLTIWSVNADGSNLHMLSKACHRTRCTDNLQATYSPNGSKIAYQFYRGVPGIGIANSQLRHVHQLFPFGNKRGAPEIEAIAWSPNGSQLAFAVHNDLSKRFKPVGGRAIYTINTNGSGLHRVTPWNLKAGAYGNLDWSPDGSNILFSTVTYEQTSTDLSYGDIYTIHPDGSDLQQLTHFPPNTAVQLGSYSPDGTQIVFTTTNNATGGAPDVFIMHADGTLITPVTRTLSYEFEPVWGPAG